MTGILSLFRSGRVRKRRVDALYAGLMAAALAPEPYAAGIVVDDMDRRVQMVSLHAALLVWRLMQLQDRAVQGLPERLHTRVFDGFDASLRETGVGDASIARKVRKLGEHYYGLGKATAEILSGAPERRVDELADLLRRNGVTVPGRETEFAQHLSALAEAFAAVPADVFLAGQAPWHPYPATSRRGVAKG